MRLYTKGELAQLNRDEMTAYVLILQKTIRSLDSVLDDNLATLFYGLVETLGQPKTVRYTVGRQAKLKKRLKTFTQAELMLAAKCIVDDDFLMGDNPNKKRYGTIDYLLRNDEVVDKFLAESGGFATEINLTEITFS